MKTNIENIDARLKEIVNGNHNSKSKFAIYSYGSQAKAYLYLSDIKNKN